MHLDSGLLHPGILGPLSTFVLALERRLGSELGLLAVVLNIRAGYLLPKVLAQTYQVLQSSFKSLDFQKLIVDVVEHVLRTAEHLPKAISSLRLKNGIMVAV